MGPLSVSKKLSQGSLLTPPHICPSEIFTFKYSVKGARTICSLAYLKILFSWKPLKVQMYFTETCTLLKEIYTEICMSRLCHFSNGLY
jgi:hypothetical protein